MRISQKSIIIFLIFIITALILALAATLYFQTKNESNTQGVFSYTEFLNFASNVNNNLSFENYQNVSSSDTQIVAIDKDLSFGKRGFTTLNGNQSNFTTQRSIVYLSNDTTHVITIDFIYLDKPLYNDLLFWRYPVENEASKSTANNFNENIICYKNVMINICIFTQPNQPDSLMELTNVSHQFVDFINNNNL